MTTIRAPLPVRAGGGAPLVAAEHLLELGHRRIAHLAGPQGISTGYLRYEGFLDAMRALESGARVIDFENRYRTRDGLMGSVAGGLGSPEGLQRQVDACLSGETALDDPWLLLVSSTVVDPDRAPGGVLKLLTIAPSRPPGAETWDDGAAEAYADRLVQIAAAAVEGLSDGEVLAVLPESPTEPIQERDATRSTSAAPATGASSSFRMARSCPAGGRTGPRSTACT